jgi:hypothetical protein
MRQRSGITFLVMLLFAATASSQFYHDAGAGAVYGRGKAPIVDGNVDDKKTTIMGIGVFYFPRYNLIEGNRSSLSIGIPFTIGFMGDYDIDEGGAVTLLVDLPLTADYNFGAAATKDKETKFGGFVGAGFGYTYSNYNKEFFVPSSSDSYEQVRGVSYGPLTHAGIRVPIGWDLAIFARAFFKVGLENARFKTFGVSGGLSF